VSERHRLHPKARREAEAAVRWYREHGGSAMALAFAHAVDDAITVILQSPQRWARKGKWRDDPGSDARLVSGR
jgi:hypothetical protein